MNIRFDGKVVLVTGASSGIGAAAASAFAESGAVVALHFNQNQKAASQVLNSLKGSGHRIFSADLSDPMETERLVNEVLYYLGRIDILVNNAGIFEESDWIGMDYHSWQAYWKRTIDTNLTGPANLSFLVINTMIREGGGKIVNVSSRGAFRGEPDALPYGSAKAGLNSLGQSMALKLASKHIYVFTLAPGWVKTGMTEDILNSDRGEAVRNQSPMKRVAEPSEMANAILMMAADGMEYMTGCIVDMNGASYLRT
jgi:NAD(P)-dependent dehydrogenase (short-subunit alcohol dehydrogenase family)